MNITLKYISAAALFLSAASVARGVPANPAPLMLPGPDGTTIKAVMHGDEHFYYYTTVDGQALKLDASGCYVAGGEVQVPLRAKQRRTTARHLLDSGAVPAFGTVRGLIILAEFADMPFSSRNDRQKFVNSLNAEGFSEDNATGSVRDYFIAQSGGRFTPEFDVAGPVRLSNDMAYYGADINGAIDPNCWRMINEACLLADDQGVDFSQYDNDGDGVVDLVYVIYSGYSQSNGATTNAVWPHMWYLTQDNVSLTLDGVRVDRYACSAERSGISGDAMAGIGLFCHEFSHTLGLPDIYDVNYTSTSINMGVWDVMDSGCYNNGMHTPAGYSAYEKSELGWLSPVVLTERATDVELPALSEGVAYKLVSPASEDEYFLLETRTRADKWDAWLPADGMLITHVDYDKVAWEDNHVNSAGNWRVHLVPANGDFSSSTPGESTPFPGAAEVTAFSDITSPGSLFNDGTPLEFPVSNIRYNSGMTTFDVGQNLDTPELLEPSRVSESGFRANWEPVAEAKTYTFTIVATSTGETRVFEKIVRNYYTLTNLIPGETYRYRVKAIGESLTSATSESKTITLATSGVLNITAEGDAPCFYTIQGLLVGSDRDALSPGIYIECHPEGRREKVVIRK